MDELKVEWSERSDRKPTEGSTIEYLSQTSLDINTAESVELEEDPEEELEEEFEEEIELEEAPEEELEEEFEEEIELEEDPEEELEEKFEEEIELEEDPEEEILLEFEEEFAEDENSTKEHRKSVVRSLSNCLSDKTAKIIEDPDEDPSEEIVYKPPCEGDTGGTDDQSAFCQSHSNEKKRSSDATAFKSAAPQVHPSLKEFRGGSDAKLGSPDLHGSCIGNEAVTTDDCQQGHSGSSGKRRRSRWDSQAERDGETGEGDRTSKRRKSRWDADDVQLKMLGPIQLPDFVNDFVGPELDVKAKKLKRKLIAINEKLQSSEIHDDRPVERRSPSPEPVYDNLGRRINTRDARLRLKLVQKRLDIISKMIKMNRIFKTPAQYKPLKFFKKLYIPVKEFPTYNFVGLILGPRGNTQKRMENETGAKILLRGKGSVKKSQNHDTHDEDELHVHIEAASQKSLDAAVMMVEKLLIPVEKENEHKRAQLKELAELKGPPKDSNVCRVCKEQGHKHYACPNRPSTFGTVNPCATCGSFIHPLANCPLSTPPVLGNRSTPNTKGKNKEISDANLYVGYLPSTVDELRLKELFSPFGKIIEAKVIKDQTTGVSKGYGFVKFEDTTDATLALARMNGYKVGGKMLAVRVAGRMPDTVCSVSSHSPLYPVPSIEPFAGSSHTAWPAPPGSVLLESQPSFLGSNGMVLPSSFCYSGQYNYLPGSEIRESPTLFSSGIIDSNGANCVVLSSEYSSQVRFRSTGTVAKYPGDRAYRSYRSSSYSETPELQESAMYHLS